jgi:hypothetical protein
MWVAVVVLIAVTVVVAWSRVGLFDLPRVPRDVDIRSTGLSELHAAMQLDDYVRAEPNTAELLSSRMPTHVSVAAGKVRSGINLMEAPEITLALETMRDGVRREPANLVLGNAYRMEVFRLRRDFLNEARKRGELTPQFPPHLDRQPIAFFEELVREHPSRETKLQLALSWVDEMLLFPALEIKAPSSVEAVRILTDILANGNEFYVPALFARGLNHLHRPARLVWPEADKTPPDAAARDIGLCVAIGRKVGGGSPRLQATLAMTLGDAYVKAGRRNVARSWWQIAQNLCRDDDIQQAVRRRYGWHDEEILDRLEEELDRARTELDHPMTDLALMWN